MSPRATTEEYERRAEPHGCPHVAVLRSAAPTDRSGFYLTPLPLIGIAIAVGYSGSIRARSAGRGQVPAVIGLSLGLVALGFVALSMITVIEIFA